METGWNTASAENAASEDHWGRKSGKIGAFFLIVFLPMALFLAAPAEGRLLNLGGSADLSYGLSRTKQEGGASTHLAETSFLQQRYSIHNFGEIIDPRIGTFFVNGTFLSQDSSTSGNATDQNFKFNDLSVALNLIPHISPLSLYFQQTVRANELDVLVKDRQRTFGANWSLSLPALPRLAVSYNQSELRGDDPNRLPSTISRYLNADSSGRIGATTIIGRYQFNQTEVARTTGEIDDVQGQAFNVTTESRLAPALALSTFWRYANIGGVNAPGHSFTQDRGVAASLFYTPSVHWDTHARIELFEVPDATEFSRFLAMWSASIRPTETLDMVVSTRYFQYDVGGVTTASPFADFNVNYRPFFGLSTGAGASLGETKTEGDGAETASFYQRYRTFVNYTRSIEVIRYTASYALSFGTANTTRDNLGEPDSDRLMDLMHTVNLGVENTQIRVIHIALGYTYNDINRKSRTVQPLEDQNSHVFQVNADSSYFRGILSPDDSLLVQSSASLTRITGFGPSGSSYLFDVKGNYFFFQGAVLTAGWTRQDYPEGFYIDSDILYAEIQWSIYFGNTNVTLGARDNYQRNHQLSTLSRNAFETTALLGYRMGKFNFNLDHRWGTDRSSGVEYTTQTIFARASRAF